MKRLMWCAAFFLCVAYLDAAPSLTCQVVAAEDAHQVAEFCEAAANAKGDLLMVTASGYPVGEKIGLEFAMARYGPTCYPAGEAEVVDMQGSTDLTFILSLEDCQLGDAMFLQARSQKGDQTALAIVTPYPIVAELPDFMGKVTASLSVMHPTRYEVCLEGFSKAETITYRSWSQHENLETNVPIFENQSTPIGYMPGVMGVKGGIAYLEFEHPEGMVYRLALPWGSELNTKQTPQTWAYANTKEAAKQDWPLEKFSIEDRLAWDRFYREDCEPNKPQLSTRELAALSPIQARERQLLPGMVYPLGLRFALPTEFQPYALREGEASILDGVLWATPQWYCSSMSKGAASKTGFAFIAGLDAEHGQVGPNEFAEEESNWFTCDPGSLKKTKLKWGEYPVLAFEGVQDGEPMRALWVGLNYGGHTLRIIQISSNDPDEQQIAAKAWETLIANTTPAA